MEFRAIVAVTAVDDPPTGHQCPITQLRLREAVEEAGEVDVTGLTPRLGG